VATGLETKMKQKQLTPNLLQLTKAGFMNAYLVREDDGLTLVDTTMNDADALIAAAHQFGAPIRRIALTHGHSDHVGSVDSLRQKLGAEVPVLISEIDARVLAGEDVDFGDKKRGSWRKVTTAPDVLLKPGDRVGSLEVIACPGHTPGHVAFLDTRDRSLIGGDAFHAIGGVTVPNRPTFPFPLVWMGTCDRRQALESAVALRALEPELLVLGHGKATPAPVAAMDAAIARAQRSA
jgi:glyoxylase-like metal-dependent hydrolase (beta-lactamase superfamily II)